jgi:hypothetical protein
MQQKFWFVSNYNYDNYAVICLKSFSSLKTETTRKTNKMSRSIIMIIIYSNLTKRRRVWELFLEDNNRNSGTEIPLVKKTLTRYCYITYSCPTAWICLDEGRQLSNGLLKIHLSKLFFMKFKRQVLSIAMPWGQKLTSWTVLALMLPSIYHRTVIDIGHIRAWYIVYVWF